VVRAVFPPRLRPEAPGPGMLRRCDTNQPAGVLGCRRRPKTKYASGAHPKELTTSTTGAQSHFEPLIWLAGRRLRSMSAAVLRMPSAAAAAMISRRLRALRSLHFLAAMTPSMLWGHLMFRTLTRAARWRPGRTAGGLAVGARELLGH
jgi:hypothetical protein